MWGWPHSSTSSITPSFQVPSQFSTSTYPIPHHTPQTQPTHSSQASFPHTLCRQYQDYNHNERQEQTSNTSYSSLSSSSNSIHTPWNRDIIGSPSYASPLKPVQRDVLPPTHQMVVNTATISSNNSSINSNSNVQESRNVNESGQLDPNSSFHKVSSNTVTNSPFSMDFILQKSIPMDNTGIGFAQCSTPSSSQYNEQSSYYQTPPQPPTHRQSQSGYYEPSLDTVGGNILHTSSNTQHISQTSSSSFMKEPFHVTDKIQPFQYDSTDFSARSRNVLPKERDGVSLSEESYSPPELVLKRDDVHEDRKNEKESLDNIPKARYENKQLSSRSGFSTDSNQSVEDTSFVSSGFQLAVSPPVRMESSASSSTTEDEEKQKNESSSSSSSSSSSDNNSNSDECSMDTKEQSDNLHHQKNEPTMITTSATSAPPPLVPTCTLEKMEGNEFEGDNDDVFLPASPHTSNVDGTHSLTVSTPGVDLSMPLSEGERKTASVVVGKRGRAAGKVLDEDKLRIPLTNGWQRIVRTRLGESSGPTRVDICYVTPCKRRLRTFPEIQRYIDQNSIPDLTIQNFSFSKKVNVGVVINEETLMNNANEELTRPRRGRPPKHLKAMKEMEENKETMHTGQESSKKDTRISLEPHEIGVNSQKPQVGTITVEKGVTVVASSSSNKPAASEKDNGEVLKLIENPAYHQPTDSTIQFPPPMVRIDAELNDTSINVTDQRLEKSNGERRGWKRKSTIEGEKAPVFKKPRGRPKGSGSRSSTTGGSFGRKSRVPRTVKYIPPPSLNYSDVANQSDDPISLSVPNEEGKKYLTMSESNRIKKQLEDKEKRRKLLLKAREGGGRRKLSSTPFQRSQRKLAQQARRERERQAKHKENVMLKQQEVELEEIRKSEAARQKESEYREQALERTRNLMEHLKKQDEERERMTRLRQLDLEKAEQLRRPTEDLLVKNLVTLPTLSKMELVSVSSEAFLDLVTVFQFIYSFEEFLELDPMPEFMDLYCGLFNSKRNNHESEEKLIASTEENSLLDVLIQIVKAVVHDPGTKTQTVSGCSLRDIEVKDHTVSEILRLFLFKMDDKMIHKICCHLQHIPFSSLCPSDKTKVLSFLTEELLRSSSLCKEIDNRMEQVCTLRRIKWKISLKLKRFRSRFNEEFGAETLAKPVLYSGRGRPPKNVVINPHNEGESSDEEEVVVGTGEEPSNMSDNESDYSDEDSDEEPSEDKEGLQKRIKEMKKKIVCIRSRINDTSQQMRVFPLGQDRFSRQYWNLPEMGGILVEGIQTSTFDALENYISEVTYRREMEMKRDRIFHQRKRQGRGADKRRGFKDPSESREASEVPLYVEHISPITKQLESDPSSAQQSDSEIDSRTTMVGLDTPTPDFTPNPSPPPLNSLNESQDCSSERSTKFTSTSSHPLEKQQFATARNRDTHSQHNKKEDGTSLPKVHTKVHKSTNQPTENFTSIEKSLPWFSLLPRKQCEVLHYLQLDSTQQQKQGLMMAPQFLGGSGYTYVTPEGSVLNQPLVQQVQMGYALVGNSLVQVPQTQYVMGQTGTAAAMNGNQLISLGNGQYALAPTAGANVQYVSINGNQYAIMQAPEQQEIKCNGIANTDNQNVETIQEANALSLMTQVQSSVGAALNGGLTKENSKERKGKKHDNPTSSSVVYETLEQKCTTTTPQIEEQQVMTLAIPGNNEQETQYVQVPADPRVLSGECSYAVLPQPDGTSQIVLVEKSSLSMTQGVVPEEDNNMVAVECPHAVVMSNEYESTPWCIDITLMYADSPLPFNDEREKHIKEHVVKDNHINNEKKLSQLLEQVDQGLTHGCWNITDSIELDNLIRCLTMRGFREKNLHKVLAKNKDTICLSMSEGRMRIPDSLTHELQTLLTQSSSSDKEEVEKTTIEGANDTKLCPPVEGEELPNDNKMEVDDNRKEMDDNRKEVGDSKMEVDVQNQNGDDNTNGQLKNFLSIKKKLVLPGDDSNEWNPFFLNKVGDGYLKVFKYLEGMETRLFDAHLPVEGSQRSLSNNNNIIDYEEPNNIVTLITQIADGLLRLEACVQRRYLKRPFKEKHVEPKKNTNSDDNICPVDEPAALLKWRDAVSSSTSSSQLGVCMNQLERCIAWEKSPMKVFCVICRTGDNESLLLLCDKCDRGTHTYCCKPKLDEIPEGNWYCHDCVINASRKSVCNVCETARGVLLHCIKCPTVIHKRCHNPPLTRVPNGPWQCSTCRRQNKKTKSNHMKDELVLCYKLLKELEEHEDSWPFLEPVDKKKVPAYYKVIKKAMDLSTVKSKLLDGRYINKETFAADARLIFDNCSFYNEDDSDIGIAGHKMKQFFEKRWNELSW